MSDAQINASVEQLVPEDHARWRAELDGLTALAAARREPLPVAAAV